MSILSFICFQCISNGISPKIYKKLKLKAGNLQKVILKYVQNPMKSAGFFSISLHFCLLRRG